MENLGQFSLTFVSLSFPVVTVVLFLNMLTINCIYSKKVKLPKCDELCKETLTNKSSNLKIFLRSSLVIYL